MRCCSPRLALALVPLALTVAACGGDSPSEPELGACEAALDLFPVPVGDATSPFPEVDDSALFVSFGSTFRFTFFGQTYDGAYLNTNGGMTFGAGNEDFDDAATDILEPAIAVFWGDMDAEEYGGVDRANQMGYQVCADRFIVTYQQYQDNDDETWNNTATATLSADGTIVVAYGTVLSEDILVGVFDGSHGNDMRLPLATSYPGYASMGSGVILFDYWGPGPEHLGELDGLTLTYSPSTPAAVDWSVFGELDPTLRRDQPREKTKLDKPLR